MDRSPLRRQIARFDPSQPLQRARTPPASWYVEPAMEAHERRAVFGRHWLPAARVDAVGPPGSYLAGESAGRPWVLTRDADGVLRALHNVCRHKAAEVARGGGRARELVCPYHGWTYRLDGALAAAPRAGAMADFDRDAAALPPMGCETWGPYVFVHADPHAAPLAPRLAHLADVLAGARADATGERAPDDGAPDDWAAGLTFVERRTYALACNWKVFCDNYLDGGYHVAGLHPELGAELDLGSYETTVHDLCSIQSAAGAGDGGAGAGGGGGDGRRIGDRATYAFVHPGLMINRYGPVLDVDVVTPTGPDRCRVDIDFFFEETQGAAARAFIEESLRRSELVQQQDVAICESVQRGLASGSYDRGRYAPAFEGALHHFHRQLAADLSAEDPDGSGAEGA